MTYANREAYIVCEDLFKIYKIADLEVVALRGLDLNVQRNEVAGNRGRERQRQKHAAEHPCGLRYAIRRGA